MSLKNIFFPILILILFISSNQILAKDIFRWDRYYQGSSLTLRTLIAKDNIQLAQKNSNQQSSTTPQSPQSSQSSKTSIFPIVQKGCPQGQCSWEDFIEIIQRIIRASLILAFWISAIASIIASLMIMLGGVMATVDKGKKLLFSATIGYAFVLLAGIIFDLVLDFFKPKLFVPNG